MKRRVKVSILAAAALGVLAGCETITRARESQREIAPKASDAGVSTATTNEAARIDLRGGALPDYVFYAITNRPSLEASRLAVADAVVALRQVTSDRALQVNLGAGYSQATANGGSHFSWHQPRGKGTADISFDLLLYDFGRLDARERAARETLIAAQRDFRDAEYDVFNEVAQAYTALLRSDAMLDVAHTNEYMYAEHLRQSESLFAAGEAKKLDVLKARVDLSAARLETINASNDVATASAEFIRTLGLSTDRASREDVIEVATNALENLRCALPETTYTAVEGLQIARTNAPSLMVLRAKLRAASAQVDYAVADLLPELTLSSAFSFADPAWNWSWGLKAAQSLLDGFRKQLAVDAAVIAMETARTAVDVAEQKLSYDLAVATAERDNARQSLEAATIEVEQARENYETVLAQYRVGDASRLDFTDAAGSLAEALGARVKAFYDGEAAEAKLIRLTGLVPPEGTPEAAPGAHRQAVK